jgi:exodeoxyribonuclease V alpha subunit
MPRPRGGGRGIHGRSWGDWGSGIAPSTSRIIAAVNARVNQPDVPGLKYVIEATPDRLREVDGIGPVRAASILAAWAEQKAVREIMIFLHSHGVGTARAVRIFKTYGADAIQIMTENPYRLARNIRGIGFKCKTADAIAMKLGIEKTAMVRVLAANEAGILLFAPTENLTMGENAAPCLAECPLRARRFSERSR